MSEVDEKVIAFVTGIVLGVLLVALAWLLIED